MSWTLQLGARLDAKLYARTQARREWAAQGWPEGMRWLDLADGHRLRIFDTAGPGPVLLMMPDGPCTIEHYLPLINRLRVNLRVICVDLPGFGMSAPRSDYTHRLHEGAAILLQTLDALQIERAALAASCVNGYYALAAARQAPDRIQHLFLSQTPSLAQMQRWTRQIVPKTIRTPVIGQALAFQHRSKIAHGWYKAALARREDRSHYQHTATGVLHAGGCYCFAGVVQGMSETRLQDLLDVQTPCTTLWGEADRSHPQHDGNSVTELIPHARLTRAPNAGHFPDLEAAPQFAQQVLDVLAPDTLYPLCACA